jgi:uncharacterized protein Veg
MAHTIANFKIEKKNVLKQVYPSIYIVGEKKNTLHYQ